MPVSDNYRPAPRHLELGPAFYDAVAPAQFPRRELRFRNQRWAQRVGLGSLTETEWQAHCAEFQPLPGNLSQPLALRYHGHQFDSYNPDLGDGRGFLFAQLLDDQARLLDLGTKGSGTTPYSRAGDGRLTLKGGIREVLATEMLEALGVNTSKSFSLFETGESLMRGDEPSPTRSSVLVRLSHSHVRIGTFQRLAFERNEGALQRLVDYCLTQYLPQARTGGTPAEDAENFLLEVMRRSAELCAQWVSAGFVHGVLNSDNMVITGESFDYGPYRFLPTFDPTFTAAYFDHSGLYCYARQPLAVGKNVARLAQSLLPLISEDRAQAVLDGYFEQYERSDQRAFLARLGLCSAGFDEDQRLLAACREFLARSELPYARFFFDWFGGNADRAHASLHRDTYLSAEFAAVKEQITARDANAPERLAHEYFSGDGPCDLLIDEIEAIWSEIDERDDFSAFEAKLTAIRRMGDALALPPSH